MPSECSWHKATYSAGSENCVEVAEGPVIGVRDTQYRSLGHLDVPAGEWAALLASVGMAG
ncbi:uncharacterized protein DUF397 [Nocardiopsis sp. Huas11]|uniref:DUF397 domain-containing protein n=1 Tax=Nocardiopsis sp. Huas11 TaxID=2183912 RepID=UPI000EB06BDE|nr:DUF397 domain-containing protein [Nocardiopsis sp. Huas11]RKS05130.1 uncharacterized protein DUF397 [Nocardiopsis sp. Huas11]